MAMTNLIQYKISGKSRFNISNSWS